MPHCSVVGAAGQWAVLVAGLGHGMQIGLVGERLNPQVAFTSDYELLTQHREHVDAFTTR